MAFLTSSPNTPEAVMFVSDEVEDFPDAHAPVAATPLHFVGGTAAAGHDVNGSLHAATRLAPDEVAGGDRAIEELSTALPTLSSLTHINSTFLLFLPSAPFWHGPITRLSGIAHRTQLTTNLLRETWHLP